MATLTLPRRPAKKLPTQPAEPHLTPVAARVHGESEAPDRGFSRREAPEVRVRAAEAPDAGFRNSDRNESYTQGRSFS